MLASQDLRIVIGALQMASILMKRLPQVFGVHFHREGVLHQIRQLADPEVPLGVSPPKCPSSTGNLFNLLCIFIRILHILSFLSVIKYLLFFFRYIITKPTTRSI